MAERIPNGPSTMNRQTKQTGANDMPVKKTTNDTGNSDLDNTSQFQDFFIPSKSLPSMTLCLETFGKDSTEGLNYEEFKLLCGAIFRDASNEPYHIAEEIVQDLFDTFDTNRDGVLDATEFEQCWNKWILKIVRPITALVIVDVQNDFINGSLAISNCPANQHGEEVVEPINRLLDSVHFDCVFYSLDWHPENHVSFIDNLPRRPIHASSQILKASDAKVYDTVVFDGNPPIQQKLWPRHCVQNSWGAKLHENLRVVEGSPFIYKGTNPEVDSYSAFWDNSKLAATSLFSELSSKDVTDVFICGLAYDVCVGATSLHSSELGFRTILIEDASRGIDFDDMDATRESIRRQHGLVITTDRVEALVQGLDRPVELGYKLALDLKGNLNARSTPL